jgi:hypothetical protein
MGVEICAAQSEDEFHVCTVIGTIGKNDCSGPRDHRLTTRR